LTLKKFSLTELDAMTDAVRSWRILIHGGAGTLARTSFSAERERTYLDALAAAVEAGGRVLSPGGDAVSAVEEAVRYLEDCPLFNAGRGAVVRADGRIAMDASIMDGAGPVPRAGAVAGVCSIRNPVSLARAVMAGSRTSLLHGRDAEDFARDAGLGEEPPEYFLTEQRRRQFEAASAAGKESILDHDGETKFGTVGAVALDMAGNLAAATSTGGLTNSPAGRISDSAQIGAGTFADNATCAVSCTGEGDYFVRATAASRIACRVGANGANIAEAADEVIEKYIGGAGGHGGCIAIAATGDWHFAFNTPGMYRAHLDANGGHGAAIFGEWS